MTYTTRYGKDGAEILKDGEAMDERIEELAQLAYDTVKKVMTENVGVHEPGKWLRQSAWTHLEHGLTHAEMAYALATPAAARVEEFEHAVCRAAMAYYVFKEQP